MKKLFFALCLVAFMGSINAQEVTTYYFIRHAEKVRTNPSDKNPHLNTKGLIRAKKWAEVFKNVKFDAVYSTDYNRTKQTAKPTADQNNLPVLLYNPATMYSDAFKYNTKGKKVLIVGHSNTTPAFVNKVIGSQKYPQIDDSNNANLYIVSITKDSIEDILLKVN